MLHILPSERQPDDIMEVNKMELILAVNMHIRIW